MSDIIINPATDSAAVDIVCGNGRTEVIQFVIDRYDSGVDLSPLAWSVAVKNAAGMGDVYLEGGGLSDKTITEDSITIRWTLYGAVVGYAGRTVYILEGVGPDGEVKRFPRRVINVLSYLSAELSEEAQEDITELQATVELVGNRMAAILAAEDERIANESTRISNEDSRENAEAERANSEADRSAAEEARANAETEREQAELARQAEFDRIDLRVDRGGTTATVTATNLQGVTTQASVEDGISPRISYTKDGKVATVTITDIDGTKSFKLYDGADGAGGGDMLKATYDKDDDGVVDMADALSSTAKLPAAQVTGLAAVATSGSYNDLADKPGAADIEIDDALDAASENPVTNRAITEALGNIDAGSITGGTLPVERGGTGIAVNPGMLVNLGSTSEADVFATSPRPGVTGTLPVARGGTGQTSVDTTPTSGSSKMVTSGGVYDAIDALDYSDVGAAASSHNHAAGNITSGTLPVARGGTGVTSNPSMLVNLGSTSAASVFATSPRPGVTGTLPVARGGTGQTSVDSTPTSGSSKMVTSGGVYTALSGKAASSHDQAASTITAGTFPETGMVMPAGTDYTTARIRNAVLTTSDPGEGTASNYPNGTLVFVYE